MIAIDVGSRGLKARIADLQCNELAALPGRRTGEAAVVGGLSEAVRAHAASYLRRVSRAAA